MFTVNFSGNGCNGVSLLGSSTLTSDFFFKSVAGGETQLIIPIDFIVGAKSLDVYFNGQRLPYNVGYFETSIGPNKGIQFIGFSLAVGSEIYIVNRKIA